MLIFSRLKLVLFVVLLLESPIPALSQGLPPFFIHQHAFNVAQNARNLYSHLNSVHYQDTKQILDITSDSVSLLTKYIGAHSAERSVVTANAQSSFTYFRMLIENGITDTQFPGIAPRREAIWNYAQRYFDVSGRAPSPSWVNADLILAYIGGNRYQREWIIAILGAFEEHQRLVQAVIEQSPLRSFRLEVNPPLEYLDSMIINCGLGSFEACEELRLQNPPVFESYF